MHSSRSDTTGTSAGQFQTNVYTKKRRKLKITRRLVAASDPAAARMRRTNRDLMGPTLDANTYAAVAELVRQTVFQYHPQQI
jgi:hypothetical protein